MSYGETSININKIEINRIVLFNKTSYGNKGSFNHYIRYRHADGNLSPQNIRLPQLTGYIKHFSDENKLINFLFTDKKLFKNTIRYGVKLKACLKKN